MTVSTIAGGPPDTTDRFLDPAIAAAQAWDKLAAYLAGKSMAFAPNPPPQQFSGGFGNLNFLLEVDGKPVVLRRPPAGPLPPGGNDMGREHRVLSRLSRKFPLAPKAILFEPSDEVLGAPFFMMEYRPGLVVRGRLPDPLIGRGAEVSRMLVETLAAFHRVRPEDVELGDLGRPAGFLERAVEGWIKRADVATDGTPPAIVATLAAWLRANKVPDPEPTLLHNDFKLDNVILDARDPVRPVAVLDWDQCTRGDPLFDLATFLSYWIEPSDPPELHEFGQMPTAQAGFPTRRELVATYAQLSGRDTSNFLFHRVLCNFKLAVVLLQLYARYRRGITQDQRFEPLGRIAHAVLDFSHEVAKGKTF